MKRPAFFSIAVVAWLACVAAEERPKGTVALESIPGARLRCGGVVGRQIDANVRNWLIRAPAANPGLLGMFELRDRQPAPNLVPWAGEFVGKYLISAIQSLRLSEDPELEKTVRAAIGRLLACQADDGYLGPFPKNVRLTANWDLWGHYHIMLALLMWHERTGDEAALGACRKAADLMCKIYLGTGRRMLSAGSDEMNLAVIHGLGGLYRKTGEARYLALMREIEKDWEKAGDYFRTGLAGVDFHRIPRPRWESLHDLQGLVELYRITGDARYRQSFLHHWHSIRRWDRHNNGAFSSGEQATGNPYQPNAIETCCTVAWMAITLDALRLTGDSLAADELELSTYNGMMGAYNPAGSWCTYNTPMDGAREASHHTIVFQARAGTPDLNCCSVNGPRGLGMLSEWGLMRSADGVTVNYYGPMEAAWKLADGVPVTLKQETRYPLDGDVRIVLRPEKPSEFTLRLRIPGWAATASVTLPGSPPVAARAGSYFEARRQWKAGDAVTLQFDMPLRYESGDLEAFGRMSIYRGPLLLAYDQRLNAFDEAGIPTISPTMLAGARISFPSPSADDERIGRFTPWLVAEIPAGKVNLRLCDYATAGSTGARYVSWLPARDIAPPPPVPAEPADGAAVPPGPIEFRWRRPAAADKGRGHTLVISETPDFQKAVLEVGVKAGHRLVVSGEDAARLRPHVDYFWRLLAKNQHGSTASLPPLKRFRVDPALPPSTADQLTEYGERADGVLVSAELAGDAKPTYGKLVRSAGFQPTAGVDGKPGTALQLDGKSGMLVYALEKGFPSYEYTVSIWVACERNEERLGQVFSAWDHAMDDPLRICIVGGKLFARIEAGSGYSTEGVPVEPGRWYHVAVVKSGSQATLYVNGKRAAAMVVPVEIQSSARDFALGGNPHFTGLSEHLACRLAKLRIDVRAWTPQEIAAAARW